LGLLSLSIHGSLDQLRDPVLDATRARRSVANAGAGSIVDEAVAGDALHGAPVSDVVVKLR
jgi:hypothetical protein